MRRAFEQGSFGFARCHAASSTVRNLLIYIPEKSGAHTYTSLFGEKFQLKTTDKDLLEEYAKDSSTFFLSLVEKPQNRDLRPLVVDIDKVPTELFGDGDIVAEIKRVFIDIIQERLEGVAEEDLELVCSILHLQLNVAHFSTYLCCCCYVGSLQQARAASWFHLQHRLTKSRHLREGSAMEVRSSKSSSGSTCVSKSSGSSPRSRPSTGEG
jgi:hypothetical protein